MGYRKRTRDEHYLDDGPKRILALDGGGVRGILSLGYLARVEAILRERHGGNDAFRLAHYYDLIAGTSTGAIIAAALSLGMTVEEVRQKYLALGRSIFRRSVFRWGAVRAKFDEAPLVRELQSVFGDRTMGSTSLETGLLVVTKRLDTGSPWPISNNPRGKYFGHREASDAIPNSSYPLWKVVRASTAAPSFFDPELITIATARDRKVAGVFVDGGVSPHNNPALQALMYATLEGYRVGWALGADRLLLTSVGTGTGRPDVEPSGIAGKHAFASLVSLMNDSADLVEILLQWMSSGPRARVIDREIGTLENDLLGAEPLVTYRRYDISLTPSALAAVVSLDDLARDLAEDLSPARIESLAGMDDPANMDLLDLIGRAAAGHVVLEEDFPAPFDLED